MSYDLSGKRIWIAGYRGMMGRSVMHRLATVGVKVIEAGFADGYDGVLRHVAQG